MGVKLALNAVKLGNARAQGDKSDMGISSPSTTGFVPELGRESLRYLSWPV